VVAGGAGQRCIRIINDLFRQSDKYQLPYTLERAGHGKVVEITRQHDASGLWQFDVQNYHRTVKPDDDSPREAGEPVPAWRGLQEAR
jgi:hypothetical protein